MTQAMTEFSSTLAMVTSSSVSRISILLAVLVLAAELRPGHAQADPSSATSYPVACTDKLIARAGNDLPTGCPCLQVMQGVDERCTCRHN